MSRTYALFAGITRWLARATAAAIVALVLTFVVSDGAPNPFAQPLPVCIELFAMLVMLLGMLIGWRWEPIGGTAILAGFTALNIVELTFRHRLAGGAFPVFAVPGLLYVASAALRRRATAFSTHEQFEEVIVVPGGV
jgi:hypothetical protein